ncbi:MAG TPA: hypothetical protein VFV34_29640 [Blastocatellia bacterium]|nr:hypothetical protein [Blastocatellia bacterium]
MTTGNVRTRAGHPLWRVEVPVALGILAATAMLYGFVFNRETTLSYSIGYNLYGAERILEGQIPYRDFHTLYPPATLYVNAALFKVAGIYLITALAGVLVFKVLTSVVVYCSARSVMPLSWAVPAWALSVIWLRPNGPFKAVPMHYGALFLAGALWLLLRFGENKRRAMRGRALRCAAAAGVSLGLVALFKHNIGAYALVGSVGLLALEPLETGVRFNRAAIHQAMPHICALLGGFAVPLTPVVLYFMNRHALGMMVKTLLFGPGEFLASRLAAAPSPLFALAFVMAVSAAVYAAYRLRERRKLALAVIATSVAVAAGVAGFSPQRLVDSLIFYVPVILFAGTLVCAAAVRSIPPAARWSILAFFVFAAAAFLESLPRFAREQVIAAMPFVAVMLVAIIYHLNPRLERTFGTGARAKLATALIPLVVVLIAARLLAVTYFAGGFRFRSDTLLSVERGRGVYFPRMEAGEIDQVVNLIQQRVPGNGYFFAHSYAGSAYLFLADRRNPSGAQFWRGVGVSTAEQGRTLSSLEENRVAVVITSEVDLAAEKYEPMRDYLAQNFRTAATVGDVLILERKTSEGDAGVRY